MNNMSTAGVRFVDDDDGDCNDPSFRTCESLPDELTIPLAEEDTNKTTIDDDPDEYLDNITLRVSNRKIENDDGIASSESALQGDLPNETTDMLFSDDKDDDAIDASERTTEDEDEGDNDLPFNSFSMLFVAESFKEHCLPIGVFGLQMLILVLIMINLLQQSDRSLVTTMNIPVDVPLTVRISQYIACLVSVFTADDLQEGALNVGRRIIHKSHLSARLSAVQRQTQTRRASFTREISLATNLTGRQSKWEIAK